MPTPVRKARPASGRGDDVVAAWKKLTRTTLSEDDRACLTAAARHADRALILAAQGHSDLDGLTIPLRGPGWHRLAVATFELLKESGAFAHLAGHHPVVCAAAEPALRAWIAATPNEDDSRRRVVAGLQHIGDTFAAVPDTTRVQVLAELIRAAQQHAVFGMPEHHISLIQAHSTADPGSGPRVRLLVDRAHGPSLATAPIALSDLISPQQTPADAAVAALAAVADHIDDLLAEHARAAWETPPPPPAQPANREPRPFPTLAIAAHPAQTPQMPAPVAAPQPAPNHTNHR